MTAVSKQKVRKQPTEEQVVQRDILHYLVMMGFYVWRAQSGGVFNPRTGGFRLNRGVGRINGVADILGILPSGRFLAIEVKSKKGQLRPCQEEFLENIRKRSGLAFVARSVEDVQRELKADGWNLCLVETP